jgi:hypothetical protein
MQRGCMQRNSHKQGPDVWQFRWSETTSDGKRLYRKKIVGTVEQYLDEDAARHSVVGLVSELNPDGQPRNSGAMTVAQLCDHFEQRELAKENTWRSHATKKIYKAYLIRWIRPHWQKYKLADVRTIQVESWLRRLLLSTQSSVIPNYAALQDGLELQPMATNQTLLDKPEKIFLTIAAIGICLSVVVAVFDGEGFGSLRQPLSSSLSGYRSQSCLNGRAGDFH